VFCCSFVPESILKKRKAREELRAKAVGERKTEKAAGKERRKGMFKRAEAYLKEYQTAERAIIDAKRAARAAGDFFVEPEAKLALVVRIRGINGVSPKVRKILQILRLRQIFNATFVRINKATLQMLQLVRPYIAWGYPNLKTTRELLYKRGYAKLNKQRIAISDNAVVETELGKHSIVVGSAAARVERCLAEGSSAAVSILATIAESRRRCISAKIGLLLFDGAAAWTASVVHLAGGNTFSSPLLLFTRRAP